jgi:protein-L-isoaspartate(D-aspartate) O-methyltransferase
MQQRRPGFPARIPLVSGVAKPMVAPPSRAAGFSAVATPTGLGLDSVAVRARMVQRLGAAGITMPKVLEAMGAVERHRFVDSGLVNQAYEDTSLPIGLGQTISKPSIVARMAELLLGAELVRTTGSLGRVLEIGTGCGYQAAVLSRLAREVYSIERLRGLHDKARVHLRPLRLANVHLLFGDGMLGFVQGAPYAGIVAAAGGTAIPPQWCEQLAVGGRLVAPIAGADGRQMLLVVDKTAHGLKQTVLESVHFVPLKSGVA